MSIEFVDPSRATTREGAARMFGTTILRVMTYLCDFADRKQMQSIAQYIKNLRQKFRLVYDSVLSPNQIIEKVGPVLFAWRKPIGKYDEKFFLETDLGTLFSTAGASEASDIMTPALRTQLAQALDEDSRNIIFDSLNTLIHIYCRYKTLQC